VEKIGLRDGLTQKAIAEEIGTTREIWRWFRGYSVGNTKAKHREDQSVS
jgi:hypothetical protein